MKIIHPIVLGKFGSAYGVRGWVRVYSYTENYKDIFKYDPLFIKRLNVFKKMHLEHWKYFHRNNILAKIYGICDRNAANLLSNHEIIIDSSQLFILKTNEYYWKDLIGCKVIKINGSKLGYVENLIETGSNDVLIVRSNFGKKFRVKKRLVPFIEDQVIMDINLKKKVIQVDWDF